MNKVYLVPHDHYPCVEFREQDKALGFIDWLDRDDKVLPKDVISTDSPTMHGLSHVTTERRVYHEGNERKEWHPSVLIGRLTYAYFGIGDAYLNGWVSKYAGLSQ